MSVILYSKPHCLECNVLKRFLKDYRICYEERDCTAHPEYLDEVKKMGFLGVPVTIETDLENTDDKNLVSKYQNRC
mgnify:CR=1 FL=1